MVKSPNAFTYSNSTGGSVSGNVMTLTLNGDGGSTIGVSNSQEPFVLWMDGQSVWRHFSNLSCRHFSY